jgi:hypothetical protein
MAFLPKPPGASAGPLHHGVPDAPAGDSAGAARGDGSRAPVRAASHPQRVLDLLPAPQPSFDNFIVGDNAELVDLLRGDAVSAQSRFVYICCMPPPWQGRGWPPVPRLPRLPRPSGRAVSWTCASRMPHWASNC